AGCFIMSLQQLQILMCHVSLRQIFYTNPRYILFAHLVLNDVLQLLMSTLMFMLSTTSQEVVCWLCIVLLCLSVLTTHATPLNLAVMAVECYVAVCFPLRHAQLCTVQRTYVVIGGIWAMTSLIILPDVLITAATRTPAFFTSVVYCERTNVFRHPAIMVKRDVQYNIYLSAIWFVLIYTYCHIFFVARAAKSSQSKSKKAQKTILLHGFQLFLCTLSYLDHFLLRALAFWFRRYILHIAFVVYVLVLMLPRLVSPILYGLRDKAFRQHLAKHALFSVTIRA
uniref:G-protein coupled receptors family 1 profile domain-containing protein n=1 Tax=Neogobius melanostomus TaxID=47308 RepID=A0A8C6TX95_9GOBI